MTTEKKQGPEIASSQSASKINFRYSKDQERLIEWFSEKAPPLVDLYKGALQMIDDSEFPGRINFIGHTMREIVNRLPEFICGKIEYDKGYEEHLEFLIQEWSRSGISDKYNALAKSRMPSEDADVPIPFYVLELIDSLIKRSESGGSNNDQKAKNLIVALIEKDEITVDLSRNFEEWKKIRRGLERWAHLGTKKKTAEEMAQLNKEVVEHFEKLQNLILAMIKQFFENLGDINEILDKANR